MKYLLLLLTSTVCLAQITPFQSSPDLIWKNIESNNFEVIFPDFLESKAKQTIELLEYYRLPVTGEYKKLPGKLKLVIRPDMNVPNGFVTLAPRRSEWFNYSSITPIVGSLEWMQSLAIHEYRHIVQYDFLNQNYINWGYKLFGEGFLGLIINYVMPTWYFEGDAVFAETILSDGGRGRSPRFAERLRAILSSGKIPSYDQLLIGDYTDNLPSFYVYGYFLITAGKKRFGADIWKNIAQYATNHPWNIYAFYNGFYDNTGVRFETFFDETFAKLASEWKIAGTVTDHQEYHEETFPFITDKGNYYLRKNLNSYWMLTKDGKKLTELNIIPSISQVDLKDDSFLYSQQLPDQRYLFKGSSDLFLYDIKKEKHQRLTENKRYYHPKFTPNKKQISAIKFDDKDGFRLALLSLDGTELKTFKKDKNENIAEASWLDKNKVAMITLNKEGKKLLQVLDTSNETRETLLAPTRNNLYNLKPYKNFIYFEADFKGKVSLFEYDYIKRKLSLCLEPAIGAHTPFKYKNKLFYSEVNSNGQKIKAIVTPCDEMPLDLFSVEANYSSKGSSDFFHKKPPVTLNRKKIKKVNSPFKDYRDNHELLSPHSWQFFSDRGFELNATSSNTLGTKSLNLYLGSSYETSSLSLIHI